MTSPRRILVFHTAFIGDVVLALPLVQVLKREHPAVHVAMVAIPTTAPLLENHQAVDECIVFDKRGSHRGPGGILTMSGILRRKEFDVAIVPHRSLRSSLVCFLAGIPQRVGFSTSAGRILFTDVMKYGKSEHEITRNLRLLSPLGITAEKELPRLYPSTADVRAVDEVLGSTNGRPLVAVAPGSVWNTKRWPRERFTDLTKQILDEGFGVVLVGGEQDSQLCDEIAREVGREEVSNTAGRLTLLQSAEMIRRCRAIVSNDSAPMHIAVAMRIPVVAIFGATVPEFGFAPMGVRDVVVQTAGLSCRPCSIHGGDRCPIKTFVCMNDISAERVLAEVVKVATKSATAP